MTEMTISLDELLADAAQELRSNEMLALSEAVQIARARLEGMPDPEHKMIRSVPACAPDEIPFYAPPSDLDALLKIGSLAVQICEAQHVDKSADAIMCELLNAFEASKLTRTSAERTVLAGRSLVASIDAIRSHAKNATIALAMHVAVENETRDADAELQTIANVAEGALASVGVIQ